MDAWGRLPTKAKRGLRKAMGSGGTLVLKTARTLVRTQSKLLKKSLGKRVKTYKTAVVAIIGPRGGFKRSVSWREGGRTRTAIRDPKKYRHLVEKGHRIEFGSGHSPAYPFLRPALDRNRGTVNSILAETVKRELDLD